MDSDLPPQTPTLFFKGQCPPCALISRLVGVLSLGTVARVPLDAQQAREFYRSHPEFEGSPVLLDGSRIAAGKAVFAALPRAMAAQGWRVLRTPRGGRKP